MKKFTLASVLLIVLTLVSGCLDDHRQTISNPGNRPKTELKKEEVVSEEAAPQEAELHLVAVGDVMFHGPQLKAAQKDDGTYDFSGCFDEVQEFIEGADLAFANYETTMAEGIYEISSYPLFNSPAATLELLEETGFDVLCTANNHCVDKGKKGILSTIDGIQRYGMSVIGTRRNAEDSRILYKEVNGIKIAVLAYTYGFNGMEQNLSAEDRSGMLSPIEEAAILADIEKAKESAPDLIVAYLHWGTEYSRKPDEAQEELARTLFAAGLDVIFGSHPHVLQRAEEMTIEGKKKFIIYSMGNFISNQRVETLDNKYTESGVIVEVLAKKNFSTGETVLEEMRFIPTWVDRSGDGKFTYRVLPSEIYAKSPELLKTLGEKRANRIVDSYETSMKVLGEMKEKGE